jgi:hypothetical protein
MTGFSNRIGSSNDYLPANQSYIPSKFAEFGTKVRVLPAKSALIEAEPNQENGRAIVAKAESAGFLYSARRQFGSLMLANHPCWL